MKQALKKMLIGTLAAAMVLPTVACGGGGGNNPFGGGMPDMSQLPEDFDPSTMSDFNGQMPEDFDFGDMGGFGGFGMGSSDVKLRYSDDNFESYRNIFNNAKTDITDADKTRLIESLKTLTSGENIESVVDIEQVIKYFVVHNFVVNGDSYTGSMIHNYYLYEEDGVLSMLPWDYNLAFGTFMSMNATSTINDPIDSPVSGGMSDRPMISWIFENEEYTDLYHDYFSQFIADYFDSGYVEKLIDDTIKMISPYVEKDPTKFCDYESFVLGSSTIKQFCLLRAESVRNQLKGDETSVDASAINISDMGTMSMGGRGDMPQFGGNKPQDTPEKQPETEQGDEVTTPPEEELTTPDAPPETNGNIPDFNGQLPEGFDPSSGEMPDLSQLPEGFDPSSMPNFNGQMPEGFDPSSGGMPDMSQLPEGFDPSSMPNFNGQMPNSAPGGMNPFGGGIFG